jgi:hypothetical protein
MINRLANSSIRIGDYEIFFIPNENKMKITWNETVDKLELDTDASMEALEKAYGDDWYKNPLALANRNKYMVFRMMSVAERQSMSFNALRYKITLSDIQKLMLLK